jgi:hypothetical protein
MSEWCVAQNLQKDFTGIGGSPENSFDLSEAIDNETGRANDRVFRMLLDEIELLFNSLRERKVIGVIDNNILSPCQPQTYIEGFRLSHIHFIRMNQNAGIVEGSYRIK